MSAHIKFNDLKLDGELDFSFGPLEGESSHESSALFEPEDEDEE